MILDSSVDRLLLMEMSYCFERYSCLELHQKGNHATHPIARFPGSRASLLRLAWNGHAALSRLARQPGKRTLGCVQLRNLG